MLFQTDGVIQKRIEHASKHKNKEQQEPQG